MDKINWGIIGCGDVTEIKSGPAFNKVPGSALVAVMRRDGEKAKDYARRHSVPKWYDDATRLINDPDVNAIYIATPPSSHETYTIAAIHAGKPVYVEKPMALSYAASKKMSACSAQKNIKLTVAHYRRQQPLFKRIKQLLEEKVIGDVRLVRLAFSKPALSSEELALSGNVWRVDPSLSGGGLFHDLAPHQLDLMYYFFGPVKQVSGIATNQGGHYTADDMVAGAILFENGVGFSGSWCFAAADSHDHCEIIGSKGKISFAVFSGHTITLEREDTITSFDFNVLPHVQQPMIEATVQYFLGNASNPCSGEEGVEVMRLMEEMAAP